MRLTPACTMTLLTPFIMVANKFIEHIYTIEANCKDACSKVSAAAAGPSGVRNSQSQQQVARGHQHPSFFAQWTTLQHSTLKTLYANITLHISHFTLHTPYFTLFTSNSPLQHDTPHFTLHTSHSTLHTSHSTLQTRHSTLRTPHSTLNLHSKTALHTSHSAHHTLHSTMPRSPTTPTRNALSQLQKHHPLWQTLETATMRLETKFTKRAANSLPHPDTQTPYTEETRTLRSHLGKTNYPGKRAQTMLQGTWRRDSEIPG